MFQFLFLSFLPTLFTTTTEAALCTSSVCEYYWEITEWITGMYGAHYPVWSIDGIYYFLNETNGKNESVPIQNMSQVIGLDGYQRVLPLINGSMPGPSIEVYENSEIIVHVYNNMANEATSIHWHGLYQHGTPWMDGVSMITQCGILPGDTFTYRFIANPKGTHFYHSHHGLQRPDGLFGALIIHDKPNNTNININTNKNKNINKKIIKQSQQKEKHNKNIQNKKNSNSLHEQICDNFGQESVLMINDWFHEHNEDIFLQRVGPGFRDQGPWKEATEWGFNIAGKLASETPFNSILFNGKGRISLNESFSQTPLESIHVSPNQSHCIRLIHSGMERTFEFSIDYHKFTIISSDGFDIQPSFLLDSLILTPGETYDIYINTTQPIDNYFIRAHTLEANYNHKGWAVLRYNGAPGTNTTLPTMEADVSAESDICKLGSTTGCLTANCPFPTFPESWRKQCIFLTNFTSFDTAEVVVYPSSQTVNETFLNFVFEPLAVNRRAFQKTSSPLLTQWDDVLNSSSFVPCNATFCDYSEEGCNCTHILEIPFNYSVQLVFTNFGPHAAAMHPIHLHGHSFQILKIGMPEKYNITTGRILTNYSSDIKCINNTGCAKQEWVDYENNIKPYLQMSRPIKKDTVVVMPGGYVIVQFITDNPGFWHLHCHMTQHLYWGLGMVLGEAIDYLKYFPPPSNFPKCGDFDYSNEYMFKSIDAYDSLWN